MKNLILLISLFVFSISLFGQNIPESVIKKNKLNGKSTFFDIQKAMNEYWESRNVHRGFQMINGVETKVPGWKLYERWEYYWEQRVNQVTGEFPKTTSVAEYEKYKSNPNNFLGLNTFSENWVNLGSNTSTGGYAGLGRINCVAFHPTDNNTIWVGSPSGGIWKTTNGGTNWTNISTGLPNIPVMCIVYNKSDAVRNVLFVGTDVGVYVKNGSNDWASYSNGLPNVVVAELEIYYNFSGDKLRAGTFGRGLWETTIESALPVELLSFTSKVIGNSVQLNWTTKKEVNNKGFDIDRTPEGKSDWEKIGYIEGKGNSNQNANYFFTDSKLNTGKYLYRLKQIDFNGNYKFHLLSGSVTIGVPDKFSISQNYPNPFNPTTKIDYSLPVNSTVKIILYDIVGREIKSLVNKEQQAGYYTIQIDSKDLSSGVYYYRLTAQSDKNDIILTNKMLIIK